MHPKGKVSPVQEAQMTTVLDANVHNLAVDGTFDDCQVGKPPLVTHGRILTIRRTLSRLSSVMPT
jgi:hypothetical protein